jgi:hypothetical protein
MQMGGLTAMHGMPIVFTGVGLTALPALTANENSSVLLFALDCVMCLIIVGLIERFILHALL